MDNRTSLKVNQILQLGSLECHVGRLLGRGSNALVYEGWYPDALNPEQKHAILLKELYPYHPQGRIYRLEDGSLEIAPGAESFFAMHRKNFEIGNDIHLQLLYNHPGSTGANLNSYQANHTIYSLLGYTGGRSLQEEISACPGDLRLCVQRMLGVLEALEAFHGSGYLHLDISPDNIMLVGRGQWERVFLIDYNSAHPLGEDTGEPLSCKPGYASPEVETGVAEELDLSSDLYSVTAVFYRCLMGRTMMLEERIRVRAPDGSGSSMLEGAPQTVVSLVRQILRKGLNILPRKRYQNIAQMQHVFQELLDRIDCIGVTHWALWESGRRSVEQLISVNPSLHYIRQEAGLYPIRVRRGENTVTLEEYLEELTGPEGDSGLLLARGGMGKTTLLLYTALQKGQKYTPSCPAVIYLSLSGWISGQTDYIRRQILADLRFKPDMTTYDSALHALEQLLQKPLETKHGEYPVMLLLLDGLNELQGDLGVLLDEIKKLWVLPGVRVLGASRSEIHALELPTLTLSELMAEDVENVLGQRGLLIPEDPGMFELLRTPLVLSIFLQASEQGKQLAVSNEEELMRAHLDALFHKEVRNFPEHAAERWQIEAALKYVLPSIAAWDGSLTDTELLRIVRDCWKILHSRAIERVFPDWIGHSRDIEGGTTTPEQWLGLMVHTILWHRMGLLMKNGQGQYQIFHQNVAKYLRQGGLVLRRRLQWFRWLYSGSAVLLAALLLGVVLFLAMPSAYDDRETEVVLDKLTMCYSTFVQRGVGTEKLLDCVAQDDTDAFLKYYEKYERQDLLVDTVVSHGEQYQSGVEALCSSGDRVSWSKLPLDEETAKLLIEEAGATGEDYGVYAQRLRQWMLSPRVRDAVPDFPENLERILDADAKLFAKLYYHSCGVHLEQADLVLREQLEKSLPDFSYVGTEPAESLNVLHSAHHDLRTALASQLKTIELLAQNEVQGPKMP